MKVLLFEAGIVNPTTFPWDVASQENVESEFKETRSYHSQKASEALSDGNITFLQVREEGIQGEGVRASEVCVRSHSACWLPLPHLQCWRPEGLCTPSHADSTFDCSETATKPPRKSTLSCLFD